MSPKEGRLTRGILEKTFKEFSLRFGLQDGFVGFFSKIGAGVGGGERRGRVCWNALLFEVLRLHQLYSDPQIPSWRNS